MEKNPEFHGNELASELTILQQELSKYFATTQIIPPEGSVWIFRLFQGMSSEEWNRLASLHDLSGWLSLPVEGDAYPQLRHFQETLERLAYQTDHDALTGLANRRAFNRTLDIELERSKRAKTPLSLAIFDLDNFKSVNDTHGHPKGDEVLATFAQKLEETTRRYDLAARYGGEEFALILAGSGIVKAQRLLDRLLSEFREITFTAPENGARFSVTCSVGLTCYKGSADITAENFLKLADDALYDAKSSGKNQIKVSKLPFVDNVPNNTLVHANEKQFLFGIK